MNSPVSGIMRFLQRVAHTRVACSKDPLPLPTQARRVKLEIHQLIHVLQDQHVAVKLHHAVILYQAERRQLGPAVVEARVCRVILPLLREQILSPLLGDAAGFEHSMAFRGEGIGAEHHEGVFGAVFLEAVVQREEAREVFCVGDEGRPDCPEVSMIV